MYWTTHSKNLVISENNLVKLDDEISFNEGALAFISTFPMAAIRKCRVEAGESAMVMGQGMLGLLAVKLLKVSGAVPIIAVDPNPAKREVAIKNGADYALDPFAEDFAQKVKEITGGGVKVCIEVTGNGPALDMALDCMAKFGRVALLGCTRNSDFTIDYYRKVHFPGITMIGAHTMARPDNESHPGWWTHTDDMKSFLRLIKYNRLEVKSMIEEIHSPNECTEVYTRLANEKSFPVVQFDWSKIE
jgi:threonine dehydrogenase-like Zn-dependent dehydrogenase